MYGLFMRFNLGEIKMYIYNILCNCVEYKKNNDDWSFAGKSNSYVDSCFIRNMLEANNYFVSLGGSQDIDFKRTRRLGMQVSKITCISFCGDVKKEFSFSYDNAKQL